MSKTTIDVYLRPYKAQYRRHWNSGTRAGKYIKTMIPLKPLDYNVISVGHVEADTVHHCGGSLSGVYAITLTVTDVLSSWTECRATWGKSSFGVTTYMVDIEKSLPFKLHTICTDNGNEFLNHQFLGYLKTAKKRSLLRGVVLTVRMISVTWSKRTSPMFGSFLVGIVWIRRSESK